MLVAFEVDFALADGRAGEYAFAKGVFCDDIEFFAGANDVGGAVVDGEIHEPFAADQTGMSAAAEFMSSPGGLAGFGVETTGDTAVLDDQEIAPGGDRRGHVAHPIGRAMVPGDFVLFINHTLAVMAEAHDVMLREAAGHEKQIGLAVIND